MIANGFLPVHWSVRMAALSYFTRLLLSPPPFSIRWNSPALFFDLSREVVFLSRMRRSYAAR
jgi:hypothetical protein